MFTIINTQDQATCTSDSYSKPHYKWYIFVLYILRITIPFKVWTTQPSSGNVYVINYFINILHSSLCAHAQHSKNGKKSI
jgi:hypothetical protein